mgnify:CR=1 FL=1
MSEKRLTPKQEAFCVAYLELASGSAAYRSAYGAGKMSDMSIRSAVSRMLALPHISQRIADLRAQVAQVAVVDTAWVVEKAKKVVELSVDPKEETYDAKAAVSALSLLAKHVGGFTDKVEHSGNVGVVVERRTPPLDDDA